MSVLLALDPNVLTAAARDHQHSLWAISEINDYRDEFSLGLDEELAIWTAYNDAKKELSRNEITNAFIKNFIDLTKNRITPLQVGVSDLDWLKNENCGEPVEPELISVGREAAQDSFMLVVGEPFDDLPNRGTNDTTVIEKLHNRYGTLQIWPVKDFQRKISQIERSRYPGNIEQLRQFIEWGEKELIEFKQPNETETRLTLSITLKALESVCAMLNSAGGWVFVGVTSTKEIKGIDPLRVIFGVPDDDYILRVFSDMFYRFTPCINQFVKPATIPIDKNRRVVILHVSPPPEDCRFEFDNGKRKLTLDRCDASNRITRCEASTKPIRTWERTKFH